MPGSQEIVIKEVSVENPGLGNCAFYAYAMALIYIIQEENIYRCRTMFTRWETIDPSISDLFDEIIAYNLEADTTERTDMLDRLQRSLRQLSFKTQIKQLQKACMEAKDNYKQLLTEHNFVLFARLYHGTSSKEDEIAFATFPEINEALTILKQHIATDKILDLDNNALKQLQADIANEKAALTLLKNGQMTALSLPSHFDEMSKASFAAWSKEREKLIAEFINDREASLFTKRYAYEDHELVKLFLSLFYGKDRDLNTITYDNAPAADAPIVKALALITEEAFYGSDLDLECLSVPFNINFRCLSNGAETQQVEYSAEKHMVTLDNVGEHWLTKITIAEIVPSTIQDSKPIESTSGQDTQQENETSSVQVFNDPDQLTALQDKVCKAVNEYIDYSHNIWFSLFHHHGANGRNRARQFKQHILAAQSFQEAKSMLIDYLHNQNNGNTHPHSCRTMLLHEFISHESKTALKEVSQHYTKFLAEFVEIMPCMNKLNADKTSSNLCKQF